MNFKILIVLLIYNQSLFAATSIVHTVNSNQVHSSLYLNQKAQNAPQLVDLSGVSVELISAKDGRVLSLKGILHEIESKEDIKKEEANNTKLEEK